MEIIILKGYESKLISAVKVASKMKIGKFYFIGESKMIKDELDGANDVYLIDALDDVEIISIIKMRFLNKKMIIINGGLSKYYLNKILIKDENNYLNIIDLPYLNHFLFLTNFSKTTGNDFENKKTTIINTTKFMNLLGIKKANISIVAYNFSKTFELEVNIIKMLLKNSKEFIDLFSSNPISELLNPKDKNSIYNKNLNLLILNNYETQRVLTDTLGVYANSKIASLNYGDNYYLIDINDSYTVDNILFSLLIINKVLKKEKSFCIEERIMV